VRCTGIKTSILSYVNYGYNHGYSHGEMMVLYDYMTLVLHI